MYVHIESQKVRKLKSQKVKKLESQKAKVKKDEFEIVRDQERRKRECVGQRDKRRRKKKKRKKKKRKEKKRKEKKIQCLRISKKHFVRKIKRCIWKL